MAANPDDRVPEEDQPDIRPDIPSLRAQEGLDNTDKADSYGQKTRGGSISNLDADNSKAGGKLGAGGLSDAEAGGKPSDYDFGNNQGIFNSTDKIGGGRKGFAKLNKRKALLGGGVGGGIAAIVVSVFLMLIPLKIEHMVQNLQDRFFSTSEGAMSDATDNILKHYIVDYVLPDYKNCRPATTRNKDCALNAIGGGGVNPVTNVYRSFRQAKLENKLAEDGIEFSRDSSGQWRLKAPGLSRSGEVIGRNGEKFGQVFNDRASMRTAVRDSYSHHTRWKRAMYRFQVGRLLEAKYGIKRCLIFCGVRDPLNDKAEAKKNAAKLYLIQRVIIPRNQSVGIAMACLLSGCDPVTPTGNSDAPAENGAPGSETDREIRASLQQFAAKFGAQNVDEITRAYTEINEHGYQKVLVRKALGPILSETAADRVSSSIPIVGWINLAAQIVSAGENAGPAVKKLSYAVNASAAVGLFSMYRTYADEIHTGHVDPVEVGSLVSSLGQGDTSNTKDPIVGGTATAEETPLYANLFGHEQQATHTSLLNSLLPSKAYAAPSTTAQAESRYICKDGKPVKIGELVCSEEKFGAGNSISNGITELLSRPEFIPITSLAHVWNGTIGKLFKAASSILDYAISPVVKGAIAAADAGCKANGIIDSIVPDFISDLPGGGAIVGALNPLPIGGYCEAKSVAEKVLPQIADAATSAMIQSPFGSNMSGGRTLNLVAGGADAAGNTFAHTGLGGKSIPPAVVAEIVNRHQGQQEASFRSRSFFARIGSTDTKYSLVSRLAMATPLSTQQAAQSGFASLTSPLMSLGKSFGSIFSARASAEITARPDPFGIEQYGYPAGSIPANPEAFWDEHCSNNAEQAYQNDAEFKSNGWNDAAKSELDESGNPKNSSVNACLLIKSSAGAAGAVFDTDNLTEDQKTTLNGRSPDGSINGGDGATVASVGGGTLPTGSSKELATKLLPYLRSGKISCNGGQGASCPDISKTASGDSIRGGQGCAVDALTPGLLGVLLGLAQKGHTYVLSALCTDHHAEGTKEHSGGLSADFNYIDGTFMGPSAGSQWTGDKLTKAKSLDSDAAAILPRGSAFGQINCHPSFEFFSGFTTYPDGCHHQHIRAGR